MRSGWLVTPLSDSTAIEGDEKPRRAEQPEQLQPAAPKPPPRKRGRPRKGEEARLGRPRARNAKPA